MTAGRVRPDVRARPALARNGIFNVRDLGGLVGRDGRVVASGRLVRGDSFHRADEAAGELRELGVVRVLDLRDDRERAEDGVLVAEGIEVHHHPVIDPAFAWHDDDHDDVETLLAHRYKVILGSFPERFVAAVESVVEVVSSGGGAVGYHCAVGKDRTGLLSAVLLGVLGVPDDVVIEDYQRSSAATAVQVSWLWTMGHAAGDVTEEDLSIGVWSARPETMRATLDWLRTEHGGAEAYLVAAGVDPGAAEALRGAVLADRPG